MQAPMEAATPPSDFDGDAGGGNDADGAWAKAGPPKGPAASCPHPGLPTPSSSTCTLETPPSCSRDAFQGIIQPCDGSSVDAPAITAKKAPSQRRGKRPRDAGAEGEEEIEGRPVFDAESRPERPGNPVHRVPRERKRQKDAAADVEKKAEEPPIKPCIAATASTPRRPGNAVHKASPGTKRHRDAEQDAEERPTKTRVINDRNTRLVAHSKPECTSPTRRCDPPTTLGSGFLEGKISTAHLLLSKS